MISLNEMALNYNCSYPTRPPLIVHGNWLYGCWMIGNDYKNKSKFYGAYPASYLQRLESMFGSFDNYKILHLFSGSLPKSDNYIRFDMVQDADVQGDAEELSQYFKENTFDIILADPPYTFEDAEKYTTPMVNRKKVLSECSKILKPGGYLVWLDCSLPMHKKQELLMRGFISLVRSTQHRFRLVAFFKKPEAINTLI